MSLLKDKHAMHEDGMNTATALLKLTHCIPPQYYIGENLLRHEQRGSVTKVADHAYCIAYRSSSASSVRLFRNIRAASYKPTGPSGSDGRRSLCAVGDGVRYATNAVDAYAMLSRIQSGRTVERFQYDTGSLPYQFHECSRESRLSCNCFLCFYMTYGR
jgi:hypothetical protein